MASVLPDEAEARQYVLGPSSIVWRRVGDPRVMAGAGAALVLQVGHPVIAGGVREFSDYQRDPWGRLLRTLDYVQLLVYGGERTLQVGRALREMHKSIKGIDPQGRRYHALEPRAYAWVHATLAHTYPAAHDMFGVPFTQAQREEFWRDWRGLGRLLGIRERDLPETWAGFETYRDEMIDEFLEPNDQVDDVLATLSARKPPPIPYLPGWAWQVARLPASRTMHAATVAMLPPIARERLGLTLTPAQERELKAVGLLTRSITPAMPQAVRNMGPSYLRWREQDIGRGNFAPQPEAPVARAA